MALAQEDLAQDQAAPTTAKDRLKEAIDEGYVIRTKYYNLVYLDDASPGDILTLQVTDLPELGVTEDDGFIITLKGRYRATVGRWMGREMSEAEADQLENEDDDINIIRYKAYDLIVVTAQETDGPEERAELRASFEQRVKKEREERQGQVNLATALADLTAYLKNGGAPQQMDAESVTAAILESGVLNPDQLEEMATLLRQTQQPQAEEGQGESDDAGDGESTKGQEDVTESDESDKSGSGNRRRRR